jgi:hypothetical protein
MLDDIKEKNIAGFREFKWGANLEDQIFVRKSHVDRLPIFRCKKLPKNNLYLCFISVSAMSNFNNFSGIYMQDRLQGWCPTEKNFYGMSGKNETGWGFCSKDCYVGQQQEAKPTKPNQTKPNLLNHKSV